MPLVRFTQNIQRHVRCPPLEVEASSVREALEAYFTSNPRARHYVLDDQGRLRQHMVIFLDGTQIADRAGLSDAISDRAPSTVDVMQALSGG